MKYILLLSAVIGFSALKAQTFSAVSIDTLSNYIYARQYTNSSLPSYGAIRKSKAQGVFSGQYYYTVVPYFSHIAALGMLKGSHPDKCDFVLRWMNWYTSHLDANGQLFNYYYKADGTGETTCPPGATGLYCNSIDAEDSDPAMFWIVAHDYYEATHDASFFTPQMKLKLENAARFVKDSLIRPDHLSIAKRSYAIKYTMDNSEVYKGFLSLSQIEATVYSDMAKSAEYLAIATSMQQAIRTLLYNSTTQLYRPYLNGATNTNSWYTGGVTACVWPQLFGVDAPSDARSVYQRQVLDESFDGSPNTDWTTPAFMASVDAFTWASIGYVFSSANDTVRGFAQADYISGVFQPPYPYPPCYVADAAWAIMNMAVKYPSPDCIVSTAGIEQQEGSGIGLYPNPSASFFTIREGSRKLRSVIIRDLMGKQVAQYDFTPLIDVSALGAGVYQAECIDEQNGIAGIIRWVKLP